MTISMKLVRQLVVVTAACIANPMTSSTFAYAQAAPQGAVASQQPVAQSPAVVSQTKLAPLPGVDPQFDERAKAIASRLRCPVCQGESIQDSPAELAAQMKDLVRERLAAGKTEKEITDEFVASYGQWILLEPRAQGINLLIYWLPVFFIVFGGAALWFTVKRWSRKPEVVAAEVGAPQAPSIPPVDVQL